MLFSMIGEENEMLRKFRNEVEETLSWLEHGSISTEEAIESIQTSMNALKQYEEEM